MLVNMRPSRRYYLLSSIQLIYIFCVYQEPSWYNFEFVSIKNTASSVLSLVFEWMWRLKCEEIFAKSFVCDLYNKYNIRGIIYIPMLDNAILSKNIPVLYSWKCCIFRTLKTVFIQIHPYLIFSTLNVIQLFI